MSAIVKKDAARRRKAMAQEPKFPLDLGPALAKYWAKHIDGEEVVHAKEPEMPHLTVWVFASCEVTATFDVWDDCKFSWLPKRPPALCGESWLWLAPAAGGDPLTWNTQELDRNAKHRSTLWCRGRRHD